MVMPWVLSMLGLAAFLVVTYLLVTYALPVVAPFVIALLIAEVLDPVVSFLNRRLRLPRSLAVIIVLAAFVALFTTAVIAGISRLIHEIRVFVANLPAMYELIMFQVEQITEQLGAYYASLPAAVQEVFAQNLSYISTILQAYLTTLLGSLTVITGLSGLFWTLLVAGLATFFISRDRAMIGQFLLSLFPPAWQPKLRRVKAEVWNSTIGYAKAQMLLILLTMLQSIIGLALIGNRYAVLMGLLIGLADILPVLGPATIYVPWILFSFLFGNKIFGLKLLILYVTVAGVRQVLEPKMVGDRMGLHPLTTLFSLYVGFKFFGPLGVVIGPLTAILMKAMIQSGLLPSFQGEFRTK
ncbi:MAG TPA: sporulation integral membrane protein YtvI [Symbiobacteriaceae bacterium]